MTNSSEDTKVKKVILSVDDFDTGLPGVLEREGYFVVNYTIGREAVEEIRNGLHYDLALIDLSLSDMGGDEVMHISKEVNPQIPIICSSGYFVKPIYADDVYQKGEKLDYLFKIIETLLTKKRAQE